MRAKRAADHAEGGIAGEVHPKPQVVDEAEVPDVPDRDAFFLADDRAGGKIEFRQRLLDRLVLDRIQLHGAQSGV
jgi:hypothetical protein